MNKNENNIGPAESGGGRVVWTCPVCRISCDDRFCPMCGISREVAIAFSGSVEPQVSAARESGDETGSWPSVSASAEKNEIYRQRISDSEALKGLTGMLDVIQTADTEEPADANGGAAPAPESVMTPEEEEIESFSRPRERTQPIPGDSPVDISAELASLTAHSRLDAPVIDIPDRPAYQPYVPPKREKVKLPRTSAASPEPLLPPELTPVFDDLPSEPLPEDRPEGYVSPVQQTAAAPENNVVQPYQEEAAGTAQSVPYYQETAAPAPDTEAGGRVTRYDTASHQAVRPRRAARRSDTSETPAVQAAQTASETYPTAAAPSDTDQAARPETPDAQHAQEKQVVYVETGDKAGLWKPVAIIGILLSAVLLLTLTYVYVKYAILIPKYGDAANVSIIDAVLGRVPPKSGEASETETMPAITAVPATDETVPEADTEAETAVPETEAETAAPETEAETEATETEAETEAETDAETAAETEAETVAETEAETSAADIGAVTGSADETETGTSEDETAAAGTEAETTAAETAIPEAETSPVEREPEPETAPEAYDINEEAANG